MGKRNPFEDIGFPQKEVPKELKEIIMQKIKTMKLLMELSENFDKNCKAAMSSLYKTNIDL
ncbi:hypothetical protein [Flagellimonas nanhaiensis]|uniref:Uncharacterized protein n=1 Tax=Flagellimonas nanhaiensis TaxID=2292706 RepID=A0A371JNV7_9FLAO|nr:hypothetical protein [Allomuricauda nanhaiensis]RDY58926.1 hypothetical protein DX873_13210 [Allomuricauda nanhaiensis]